VGLFIPEEVDEEHSVTFLSLFPSLFFILLPLLLV